MADYLTPAGTLDFLRISAFRGPDEELRLLVVWVDVGTDRHDELLDVAAPRRSA
jgi:hypothetical protein